MHFIPPTAAEIQLPPITTSILGSILQEIRTPLITLLVIILLETLELQELVQRQVEQEILELRAMQELQELLVVLEIMEIQDQQDITIHHIILVGPTLRLLTIMQS